MAASPPFPNLALLRLVATSGAGPVEVRVQAVQTKSAKGKPIRRWLVRFRAGKLAPQTLQKDRTGVRLWSDLNALADTLRAAGVDQVILEL